MSAQGPGGAMGRGKPGNQSGADAPGAGAGNFRKKTTAEIADLRARVAQLEQDIMESRRLNKRLAEVTDVVAEVLLPSGQRDDAHLRDLLADYNKTL